MDWDKDEAVAPGLNHYLTPICSTLWRFYALTDRYSIFQCRHGFSIYGTHISHEIPRQIINHEEFIRIKNASLLG